jgi:hypothetical protein
MSDPYRISEAPTTEHDEANAESRRGPLRPVLWVVLVLSAVANAISSSVGVNPFVGGAFGLVTLACATALIVHHYQHRRD